MALTSGTSGAIALKGADGRFVSGVTVSVPTGYTATVDGFYVTVTGPPADDVVLTTTTSAGLVRSHTVAVRVATAALLSALTEETAGRDAGDAALSGRMVTVETDLPTRTTQAQVDTTVQTAITALVGAAPATLDTLVEIAGRIAAGDDTATALAAALGTETDARTAGDAGLTTALAAKLDTVAASATYAPQVGLSQRGVVCFVWDDGYVSHDQIATLAAQLNQRHTFGVVSSFLTSGGNFASAAMVAAWHALGHEIAAHSVDHTNVTLQTVAQRAAVYEDSRNAIEAIIGAGKVTSWVYPFGAAARNATTDKDLHLRYDRILDTGPGLITPLPRRDDFLIRRTAWGDTQASTDEVLALIRYAATHPVVVVLTGHNLGTTASPTWANVQAAMQLAASLGVPCVPVREAFPGGNLVRDGGFETAGLPDWQVVGSNASQIGERVVDTPDVGLNGAHSLRLATTGNTQFVYAAQPRAVEPGKTYRFGARTRLLVAVAGTGAGYLRIREYTYDPQAAVSQNATSAAITATSWTTTNLDYVAGSQARFIFLDALVLNSQAEMWVDHIDFRERAYGNFG